MAQKISNEEYLAICEKYLSGINTPQLAKEYSVNSTTIRTILIKNKIEMRKAGESNRKARLQSLEIAKMYNSGISAPQISKNLKMEISRDSIIRELKLNSVKIKKSQNYRKYHCNFDFFEKINTEHKAYWAGFIAADGAVTVRKKQSSLTISLSAKDKKHLEKFKKIIESEHIIRDYKVGEFDVCSISISNRKIVEDLKKCNIVQNKSLIYSMPKNIPENLLNHFVRGCIDGDGGFYVGKNKKGYCYHSFEVTGSVEFITELQNLLMQKCLLNKTKLSFAGKARTLRYSGRLQVKRIHDWIYEDATIFLERKRISDEYFILEK